MIRPLGKGIRQLGLLLLVSIALLVLAAQYFLAHISDYHSQIESSLSRTLGTPVSIGEIKGKWRGFGPELELHDIQLLDEAGNSRLRLTKVRTYLHLLDSLLAGRLMPREITLHDLTLLIKRRADRSIIVAGLEGDDGSSSASGVSLFGMPFRVHVVNAELHFEDELHTFGNKRLSGIDLKIDGAAEHFHVSASVSPKYGDLQISANLKGDPTIPGGWSGETYASGKRVDFVRLLGNLLPWNMKVQSGVGELEVWSHWRQGLATDVRGNLKIQNAAVVANSNPFSLDLFEGQFGWSRNASRWRLDLDQLKLQRNGLPLQGLRNASILFHELDAGYQLSGKINSLEIMDLTQLSRLSPFSQIDQENPSSPLPSETLDWISQLSPSGQVKELSVSITDADGLIDWNLFAQFDDFNCKKQGKIPALSNISGSISASSQGGRLLLDSSAVEMEFETLFREKIALDQLTGELNWEFSPQGEIVITANQLLLKNRDFTTQSRFRLELPGDGSSPFLDLQSDFQDVDGSQTPHYVPMGIMQPQTVAWLDQAIIAGRIPQGTALLRGPLKDFPFHITHTGRFEALFDVKDVTVSYLSEWPQVHQLDGEVRFLGNGLEINSSKGLIYDSNIQQARVTIAGLKPFSDINIHGKTTGPLNNGLRLFRETPLRKTFGRAFKGITAKGRAEVELELVVPHDKVHYQLDGAITLIDSSMLLKEWNLKLEETQGTLTFDLNGVYADNIKTHALGNPLQIATSPSDTHQGYIQVKATGPIGMNTLARHFADMDASKLIGSSIWQLNLELPPLNAGPELPLYIQATSDLKGMEIQFPAPIGKQRQDEISFRLDTQLIAARPDTLEIHYGNIAQLLLKLQSTSNEQGESTTEIQAGEVALGDIALSGQPLPETGLRINAQLEQLKLSPWLELINDSSGTGNTPKLAHLHANIDHLELNGSQLESLSLTINSDPEWWRGMIRSQQLGGTFSYPKMPQTGTAEAHLDFIKLTLQASEEKPKPASTPKPKNFGIDPRTLPPIRLVADHLMINEGDFGTLTITADQVPQGLSITRIAIGKEAQQLSGTGSWLISPEQAARTALNLSLKSDSLGDLLTDLKLVENLQQAPATISGEYSWSGNPVDVSAINLEGDTRLMISQGKVPKIEPGLGRLFGLLNISTLQRRLSLDFSDLFDKGFSFDKIEGNVQFAQGKALTDDLIIDGPAARIEISGAADLTDATLDHQVLVSGKLSSTLPLAGTLTGGPAVGAALLIAQQLIGDQMDKISAVKYSISGPWDEPEILNDTDSNSNEDENRGRSSADDFEDF